MIVQLEEIVKVVIGIFRVRSKKWINTLGLIKKSAY